LLLEALLGHTYVNFIVNVPDVDLLNRSSHSFYYTSFTMAVTRFWCHALFSFLSFVTLFTSNVLGDSGIIKFPITVVDAPASGLAKRQVAGSSEYPVTLANEQTLYLVEGMHLLRLAPNSNRAGTKLTIPSVHWYSTTGNPSPD
jgi:hypothetical protein